MVAFATIAVVYKYNSNKTADMGKSKSDLIEPVNSRTSSNKPVIEQSIAENEKFNVTYEHKDINTIGMNKLENDIKDIFKNEYGIYSVAFQNTSSNEILSINPKKLQSASIIKLFVMIEAFNEIKEDRINENDEIILKSNMKVGGTGSLSGRKDGTAITINQLIKLMITQSDNTATNILIDILTMDKINSSIKVLGCSDSVIQRKMMDFKAQNEGKDNFTSVEDLCCVLFKIYKNECLGGIYDKKMIDIMKQQENNTKIPLLLPPGTVVAHKTGELDKVENDAGIIYNKDGAYILCILSNGVETTKARGIISKLSRIVYDFSNN